jgi:hypothetical protein
LANDAVPFLSGPAAAHEVAITSSSDLADVLRPPADYNPKRPERTISRRESLQVVVAGMAFLS